MWPAFSACVHARFSGGCGKDEIDKASPRHSGMSAREGKQFSADRPSPQRRGREGAGGGGEGERCQQVGPAWQR
jgi:hypothetical protein